MNCPRCGGPSSVRETRKTDYGIRRRRFCEQRPCAARFTTAEVIIPENVRLDGHDFYHLVIGRDLDTIMQIIDRIRYPIRPEFEPIKPIPVEPGLVTEPDPETLP